MMKNIGNNKKKIVAIVVCVAIVATIGTATAFAVNASKATGFVSDVNGTRTFNDDSATAGLDK
ncbi:MAG: hypothetical protein LBN26_10405, partial [Christensenellaceae bacterium]|nr:hypothetical protein [Christensenellaceae bacterium]MDR0841772.1 hypothetical protein [Christensenellaceae bacterium]